MCSGRNPVKITMANGKKTISLSYDEWEIIGLKAGWAVTDNGNIVPSQNNSCDPTVSDDDHRRIRRRLAKKTQEGVFHFLLQKPGLRRLLPGMRRPSAVQRRRVRQGHGVVVPEHREALNTVKP